MKKIGIAAVRDVMNCAAARLRAALGCYWPAPRNGDPSEASITHAIATNLKGSSWRVWAEARYPPLKEESGRSGRLDMLAYHSKRPEVWLVEAKHLYMNRTYGKPIAKGVVEDIDRLRTWRPLDTGPDDWFRSARRRFGIVALLAWSEEKGNDPVAWWHGPQRGRLAGVSAEDQPHWQQLARRLGAKACLDVGAAPLVSRQFHGRGWKGEYRIHLLWGVWNVNWAGK